IANVREKRVINEASSLVRHANRRIIERMDFHDFEHAGWERAADHYGDAFGSLTSQTIPALLRAVAVERGTRLLDVASGPGYVSAEAAKRGASTVGVDFAAEMVALASKKNASLTFQEGV